jgi:hypothetical protein
MIIKRKLYKPISNRFQTRLDALNPNERLTIETINHYLAQGYSPTDILVNTVTQYNGTPMQPVNNDVREIIEQVLHTALDHYHRMLIEEIKRSGVTIGSQNIEKRRKQAPNQFIQNMIAGFNQQNEDENE